MVDIEIIKRDLRQLRKVTHSIEAFMTMKDKHEKRLEYLSGLPPSKEVDEEKKRIEELLKRIDIQGYIARATALEEKYMAAIDKLDPLDKKIIIDGYINGKAYYKIGWDIGFSTQGVQNRITIINSIATYSETLLPGVGFFMG